MSIYKIKIYKDENEIGCVWSKEIQCIDLKTAIELIEEMKLDAAQCIFVDSYLAARLPRYVCDNEITHYACCDLHNTTIRLTELDRTSDDVVQGFAFIPGSRYIFQTFLKSGERKTLFYDAHEAALKDFNAINKLLSKSK